LGGVQAAPFFRKKEQPLQRLQRLQRLPLMP
jgi:hypothetical protein